MTLPPPPVRAAPHPVDVGTRTEAVVLAELVKRGYRVLLPFGHNHRYDLVLDVEGHFVRVQCKTGRLSRGCVIFRAQSIRSNRRVSVMRDYKDDVDWILVHCPANGALYAIPIEEATRTQGTLRVDPTANGQEKGVRWARDFELPA